MKSIITINIVFSILTIFSILNFIHNINKLEPNMDLTKRKIVLTKLCIYGVLSAIGGLIFTGLALSYPGVAYLV